MSKFIDIFDVLFEPKKSETKQLKKSKSKKSNSKILDVEFYAMSGSVSHKISKKNSFDYSKFVADYYRELDYVVWEHGKEKGKSGQGIDLIVKKKEEIIFIQCKNKKEKKHFKIDHKEVKASRREARQFMKENPLFGNYKIKFRYTLSCNCLHATALDYIEENKDTVDYEIVNIKNK